MLYTEFDNLSRQFLNQIIDAEFLTDVDKLTRYTGETIYNEKVSLTNCGTVCKVKEEEDIDVNLVDSEWKINFNTGRFVKNRTYYDLTVVRSSSVCSEFDSFLLVSERTKLQTKPRELFIYCVKGYGKGTKYLPSINKVKKDIRSGEYKSHYGSLLYEFCGVYSLSRPTDNCDKLATLGTLICCIDMLYCDNPELFKIDVEKRNENKHKEI